MIDNFDKAHARVLRTLSVDFMHAWAAQGRPRPTISVGQAWLVQPECSDRDAIEPITVVRVTDSGVPVIPGPHVSVRYAVRKHELWLVQRGVLFTSLADAAQFMTVRRMWLRDRLLELADHLKGGLLS